MEYKTRKASINDWANIEIEQGVPVTESHVNLYRWIDLAREMKENESVVLVANQAQRLARAINKLDSFKAVTRTYKENSKRIWKVKRKGW
jgi:hypothetical protein